MWQTSGTTLYSEFINRNKVSVDVSNTSTAQAGLGNGYFGWNQLYCSEKNPNSSFVARFVDDSTYTFTFDSPITIGLNEDPIMLEAELEQLCLTLMIQLSKLFQCQFVYFLCECHWQRGR